MIMDLLLILYILKLYYFHDFTTKNLTKTINWYTSNKYITTVGKVGSDNFIELKYLKSI